MNRRDFLKAAATSVVSLAVPRQQPSHTDEDVVRLNEANTQLHARVAELEEEIYWREHNFQRQMKEMDGLYEWTHLLLWREQECKKLVDAEADRMRSANSLLRQRVEEQTATLRELNSENERLWSWASWMEHAITLHAARVPELQSRYKYWRECAWRESFEVIDEQKG